MAGTLREKSPGVWELRAFSGRDPVTGRKRQVSRTVRCGRREAEKRLAELVADVFSGNGRHGDSATTFGELLDRYFEQQQRLERSPVTLRTMSKQIESVLKPGLGRIPLRRLGPADLDAFYAAQSRRGLSPNTVRRYHAHVSAVLNQAVKWGWIATNPAKRATPPPMRWREIDPPEVAKVRELLNLAEQKDPILAMAVAVAALTGARRGEVCGLRWCDIDFDAAQLTISRSVVRGLEPHQVVVKSTKTGRIRRLSLDPVSIALLLRHRTARADTASKLDVALVDNSFVFSPESDGSAPYNPEQLTVFIHRLRNKAGLPNLRFHDLRHFAATQLVSAGVDVRTVAGRLGHSNPSITLNVYAHFIEHADREAARRVGELMKSLAPG